MSKRWEMDCRLKWQCHEIFHPRCFFHQTIPPRALIHRLKPFRIRLRIHREKSIQKTPKSDFSSCQSSPLMFTFSSNNMYVMFTHAFFCYGFPLKGMGANNPFCERSRGVIKDPAVSLTPRNLNISNAKRL
jgi:hypothetical protein